MGSLQGTPGGVDLFCVTKDLSFLSDVNVDEGPKRGAHDPIGDLSYLPLPVQHSGRAVAFYTRLVTVVLICWLKSYIEWIMRYPKSFGVYSEMSFLTDIE